MKTKVRIGAAMAVSAIALVATVADARHQWRKYEWAYDGTPINVVIYDSTSRAGHEQTSRSWSDRVADASADWNVSSRIDGSVTNGNNPGCDLITGQIHVCSDDYGSNGWLGIASISINGNEIIAGSTKLNDFYFAQSRYNSEDWKQLVACQEIGHDYGLAHQNENFNTDATTSCMEYTSWPAGNTTPDQHDYDQLEAMYTVSDGSTGGGRGGGKGGGGGGGGGGKPAKLPSVGNTQNTWGTPIDYLPNGKPFMFEREMNGYRIITHVTWTIEEALEQGGHHDGPVVRQHSGDHHFDN